MGCNQIQYFHNCRKTETTNPKGKSYKQCILKTLTVNKSWTVRFIVLFFLTVLQTLETIFYMIYLNSSLL